MPALKFVTFGIFIVSEQWGAPTVYNMPTHSTTNRTTAAWRHKRNG